GPMRNALVAAVLLLSSTPCWAEDPSKKPERDPARLLAEGMRTGEMAPAEFAVVARWFLEGREETVATGVREALRQASVVAPEKDARWDATTRAVLGTFDSVLANAAADRRLDGNALFRDLLTAAGPEIAAALREAGPGAADDVRASLGALASVSGGLVPALTHALGDKDPMVRLG